MKNFICGVIIGAAFMVVGNWSYEDEVAEQQLYCKMNSGGLWYDSAERYAKICPVESGAGTGQGESQNTDHASPDKGDI